MNKKILLSEKELQKIIKRLGLEITEALKNEEKPALIVGVLKGATPFFMDLIKQIDAHIYTDFIQVSSYSGTENTGKIQLIKDITFDCKDRTVIIVEDIVDTGNSMSFLINHLTSYQPKQILICSLFDKKEARKTPININFVGKELVGNDFLIGYGLDYYELERNLPYVYCATKEDIEELDKFVK